MCNCIEEFNKKRLPKLYSDDFSKGNLSLHTLSLPYPNKSEDHKSASSGKSVVAVQIVKQTASGPKKFASVAASYCPFCGTKY